MISLNPTRKSAQIPIDGIELVESVVRKARMDFYVRHVMGELAFNVVCSCARQCALMLLVRQLRRIAKRK